MTQQMPLEEKTNEELFALYKNSGDVEIKQELVLRYIYIVKNIAIKMKGVYMSFAQMDDIINESVLVLMAAIDKFDPSMQVRFESYISKRLRGLIIDMARKQDWIPRNIRKNARLIEEATNTLYHELGRFPTDEEMAAYFHVSVEKYRSKMLSKTNLHSLVSLDALFEGQKEGKISSSVAELTDDSYMPEEFLEEKEQEEVLKDGIAALRENEQTVLSLHYQKELNMKEIARVMELSESRISQIHTNALRKLRLYMQEHFK